VISYFCKQGRHAECQRRDGAARGCQCECHQEPGASRVPLLAEALDAYLGGVTPSR
jgi:hypothetical protein